jgi:hypothetical protein
MCLNLVPRSVSDLSDDDCLEQQGALQKLKSGNLPLDLKALHSVCLLGVGGQNYVALMNLERVVISVIWPCSTMIA